MHKKKIQRELHRNMEVLEQQMVYLQEENTHLKNENNNLKDDNMKMYKFVKGLEWDIEAVCRYLEKQQDKNETDD